MSLLHRIQTWITTHRKRAVAGIVIALGIAATAIIQDIFSEPWTTIKTAYGQATVILSRHASLPFWTLILLFLAPIVPTYLITRHRYRPLPVSTTRQFEAGILWVCDWKDNVLTSMVATCPVPGCGQSLKTKPCGQGDYPHDPVFYCEAPECGFAKRFEWPAPRVRSKINEAFTERRKGGEGKIDWTVFRFYSM